MTYNVLSGTLSLYTNTTTTVRSSSLLCKNYSVTQPQAHGRFRACVWQAFVCHLAGL